MDHTHIVQADDLERFAFTRKSEAVIPELIYLLVKQSISVVSVCRIPYGDAVNQPGCDGVVHTESGFLEFVPDGKSYWEVGTDANPRKKANDEYRKRTIKIPAEERAEATFVFVTPRYRGWGEPEQSMWLQRRNDSGWKSIRIIDGVKLADWLREFPSVGRWMAKQIELSESLGGLSTPRDHWENIEAFTAADEPTVPPRLFLEGRGNACSSLQGLFEGKSPQLLLFAESRTDVADFVAAYIETLDKDTARNYAYRCIFVTNEDAWRSFVELRKSHVLVADPRLGLEMPERADLLTIATRKGHAVVVPICGAPAEGSDETVMLRSPSQSQIETVLKDAGYSDNRSKDLAGIGGDRVSALRRHLQRPGMMPPYATWESVGLFAQAGLVGRWDGKNPADQAAIQRLLAKGYGEWIDRLRPDVLRTDSPLIQIDEKWRFVLRTEAWSALGNRITDEDLARFQQAAITVLQERHPNLINS